MNLPNKYCHNCGKQTAPAAKFCSSCGTSLASIDEKPPVYQQPNTLPNRVNTFTPVIAGEDDEGSIRADHVSSLAELGISLANFDVEIIRPNVPKESVGSLIQQGQQLPQGYKEQGRIIPPIDSETVMKAWVAESSALRKE